MKMSIGTNFIVRKKKLQINGMDIQRKTYLVDYNIPIKIGRNEQKSADKIEPRFKVGDWVVNKFGDSWHIDSLDKKNYQVSDRKGNYNYFTISRQDEMHF